jgi:hypothetical protein
MVNELSSAQSGAVVFAAATGLQTPHDDKKWNNGAFTKALVEALLGKASSANGTITVNALDTYITLRVKQLTAGKQTPTMTMPRTIHDFPVAMTR